MSTYPFTRARNFSKLNSRLQGAEAHRFDGLRLREGIISSNRSIRNKNTLKVKEAQDYNMQSVQCRLYEYS